MGKVWTVIYGSENVKIYDVMFPTGNGNVRFSGTVESALQELAITLETTDQLRSEIELLKAANEQLETRLKKREPRRSRAETLLHPRPAPVIFERDIAK